MNHYVERHCDITAFFRDLNRNRIRSREAAQRRDAEIRKAVQQTDSTLIAKLRRMGLLTDRTEAETA